jgi:hypothetical protein
MENNEFSYQTWRKHDFLSDYFCIPTSMREPGTPNFRFNLHPLRLFNGTALFLKTIYKYDKDSTYPYNKYYILILRHQDGKWIEESQQNIEFHTEVSTDPENNWITESVNIESIDIYNDDLLIGFKNYSRNINQVYGFKRGEDGHWKLIDKVEPPFNAKSFGDDIRISGNKALIRGKDDIYLFFFDGSRWVYGSSRVSLITTSCSFSLSENHAIVNGTIYAIHANKLKRQTEIFSSDDIKHFGEVRTSISGDYAVFGLPQAFSVRGSYPKTESSIPIYHAGKVTICIRNGSEWLVDSIILNPHLENLGRILIPANKIVNPSEKPIKDGNFGYGLAIQGDYLIIGAPSYRPFNIPDMLWGDSGDYTRGKIYIYKLLFNTTWNLEIEMSDPVGHWDDRFGENVFLDGSDIMISTTRPQNQPRGQHVIFGKINGPG